MGRAKTIEVEKERVRKISEAHKGRKHPWTSERNRIDNPSKRGENHYYWKGGKWKYIKRLVLIRDNFTCQICGMREDEIMVVDHIKPKSVFPELELESSNLIVLCPNCHARKTIREKKQKYDRKFYE